MIFKKIKFIYQHKWKPYRNYRIAKKILQSNPVVVDTNGTAEIHVLTCSKDYLMLIWALKSFYWKTKKRYPLCVHEDGSLSANQLSLFEQHFPGCRIIEKIDADKKISKALKPYPHCLQFRTTNHLAPKVFDFYHYCNASKIILFDSDLLFFALPAVLLDRIENNSYKLNTVNGDVSSAYTVSAETIENLFSIKIPERFNSGLGLIHKESIRPEVVEKFLHTPDILGHFWRIEQTCFMLCSAQWGCELLPKEYDVFLSKGFRGPLRHYVGAVRELMYTEGMKRLIKEGILKAEFNEALCRY